MDIDIVNDTDFNFWKGNKVLLRSVRESDWEQRVEETTDSNCDRLLQWGVELPKTEEMSREFVQQYADFKNTEGRIMFSIDNLKGEHVGGINLNSFDYKNGTFSVGMRIYRKYRNNGYGGEALRIVLRYAFFERRLQKCNSGCVSVNGPSKRLHGKVGFQEEGLRRRDIYMNGRYYDNLLFGLTTEEFEANEREYAYPD